MERHNGIEPDPEGAFVYYADAQAAVEALQREREQWVQAVGLASTCAGDMEIDVTKPIEMMQVVCQRFATLTAALDAEREKVKGLEDKLHAMYANHPEASCYGAMPKLRAQLTQLRALVRALPVVEGPVKDEDIFDNWESDRITFDALRGLLEYRATLDATTPARQQE